MTTVSYNDFLSLVELEEATKQVEQLKKDYQWNVATNWSPTPSSEIRTAEKFAVEIQKLFLQLNIKKFSNGEFEEAALRLNRHISNVNGSYQLVDYYADYFMYKEESFFSILQRKYHVVKNNLPKRASFLSKVVTGNYYPEYFILDNYPANGIFHRPYPHPSDKWMIHIGCDNQKGDFYKDIPILLEAFSIWIENQE